VAEKPTASQEGMQLFRLQKTKISKIL